MREKILITGGCGFAGHHIINHFLVNTDFDIIIIDKLTYASFGLRRLEDINVFPSFRKDGRVKLFSKDFSSSFTEEMVQEIGDVNYIFHLGAETHVDNSIINPEIFVKANVLGTFYILEFAKKCKKLKKMFYFSTDEVFGPAKREEFPNGFKEWDRYKSSNPYAATKAGGEELCIAYENTYKVPIVITHTMNLFGERQHSEKYIPKVIKSILKKEKILIHSDTTKTIPGSRFWIHCRNVAKALFFLLGNGKQGEKYNIVGEKEVNNLELAELIAKIMGKKLHYELVDFHSSRPGHDLRYALDGAKLKNMGFSYPKSFEESLEKTVFWTLKNLKWLEN